MRTGAVSAWVWLKGIITLTWDKKVSLLSSNAWPKPSANAVHAALRNLICRKNIPDRDYVYFNLATNRLNHAYGYRRLTAEEWLRGSDRVGRILQQMARVLNSNKQFELEDSFQLLFTQVRAAPQGSGGTKSKLKPGHAEPQTFKHLKHSVVTIKNKDELCCGRGICHSQSKGG